MIDYIAAKNKLTRAVQDGDKLATSDNTALGSANRNYLVPASSGVAGLLILAVTVIPFLYSLFGIGSRGGKSRGRDRRDIRFKK